MQGSLADCITNDHYAKIAQVLVNKEFTTAPGGGFYQYFEFELREEYVISAILTTLDSQSNVNASTLDIWPMALDEDAFFKTPVWYQLPGENASHCENCSTVSIAPVPPHTKRVHVNAELQPATESALLYLTSFAV